VIKRLGCLLVVPILLMAVTPVHASDIEGKASLGGSLGIMKFASGEQWKDGNAMFILQAMFKYNFSGHLAGVLESGWGWNNYDTSDRADKDTLATVVPTTLGLEYRWRWGESKFWPHFAAGGGFYALGIKDGPDDWAYATDGTQKLTWVAPGLYGKLGGEFLMDSGIAINIDLLYHAIFAQEERFDSWGNTNTSFFEFRVGINYYFTLKDSGPAPPSEE